MLFFFFTGIKSFRVTRTLFEHEAARKSVQISSERQRNYFVNVKPTCMVIILAFYQISNNNRTPKRYKTVQMSAN